MKTLEQRTSSDQNEKIVWLTPEQKISEISKTTSDKLATLFWIKDNPAENIAELADSYEVTPDEVELWYKLRHDKKILELLGNKQISLATVMQDYDTYEESLQAT